MWINKKEYNDIMDKLLEIERKQDRTRRHISFLIDLIQSGGR